MSQPGALVFASIPGSRPNADRVQAHVRSLRRAGVTDIAVVQPPSEVRPSLSGVQLVMQLEAWNDPFDALVLGAFAVNTDALIVLPAENDLLSDATMKRLVGETLAPRDSFAVAPIFKQRRGYPVVLFRKGIEAVVNEASQPNGKRYLEALLVRWGAGLRLLAVPDDAVTYRFGALA
jgi:CTP:molybdopterin cytidylyltransferase MocA